MMFIRSALFLAWALAACAAPLPAPPQPLTQVHAHNDYQHPHPLRDALDQGFCSVEADVHLVDGQLLVAHSRSEVKPGRTLQGLYLDPLREQVKQNGGRVYPGGPEFTLLVELKDPWATSYPTLRQVLEQYPELLTTYEGETKHARAITVIITGHRSPAMFAGEKVRYAAIDGELKDLEGNTSAMLIPWISTPWGGSFHWKGTGAFPEAERLKLQGLVQKAHQQGRKVRFWGAPDFPAFWRELQAAGVDLINTDDLAGARGFLTGPNHSPAPGDSAPGRRAAAPGLH